MKQFTESNNMKPLSTKAIIGLRLLILMASNTLIVAGCGKGSPVEETKLIGTWELSASVRKQSMIFTYYTNHIAVQKLARQGQVTDSTVIGRWKLDGNALTIEWDYTTNSYSKGERIPFVATLNANVSRLDDSEMLWRNGWHWSRVEPTAEQHRSW